jgi:hypothetical protein
MPPRPRPRPLGKILKAFNNPLTRVKLLLAVAEPDKAALKEIAKDTGCTSTPKSSATRSSTRLPRRRRAAERRIIMGHIDDARTRPDLAGSWRTVVLPATTLARCAAVRVSIRIVLLPWNIRPTATSAALPPARWVLAPRRVESFNTSVHEDVSTSTPCCRSRRTAGRSDWCPWSNDDHSRRAVTWPCWWPLWLSPPRARSSSLTLRMHACLC